MLPVKYARHFSTRGKFKKQQIFCFVVIPKKQPEFCIILSIIYSNIGLLSIMKD